MQARRVAECNLLTAAVTQIEDNGDGNLPADRLDPSEVREYRTLKVKIKALLDRIEFTQKVTALIRRTLVWLVWAIGGLWAAKDLAPWIFDTLARVIQAAGPS